MPTEAKDRFFCIECSVQVVVGGEAQVQSESVRFQLEQRLCTSCMNKRKNGTKQAEKHNRESVRVWRDRT
jgi:RNase P subunit RPR2